MLAVPAARKLARELGIDIETVEGDPILAEAAARQHADKAGLPYLSPYNDVRVVAG